jgi:tetratricopeptide (TPR) repeat protein/serine/threonine protein kinase
MTEPSLPEESLFAKALEIASAAERVEFLDLACASNPALRAEVEALLRAHEQSGDLLDLPELPPVTTDLPAGERPGTVLGPYKLLEQIGEGGMGTVWMAEQTEPIRRRVAVKVIKEGMDSRQVLARFEAERQALALMEHPNIARVLDAGKTPSGRPYFVMELVKGQPITQYCDEKRLGVRERLELFGDVCRAVQHAHQKGIIHRDIKPSNVLVAPYDGKPVVKVIDFGVAKATGQRLTDRTLFTGFGALVGTPEYMSPEQAEVNNQDIDTRSDIYSLGVLLYELLTGSTPLTRKRVKEAALLEVLRVIREEEPAKPSTRLSESKDSLPSISAQRQTEPAKLTKLVRGELDWIVMKALDKDRSRRYETANGFAMDVQRYLADEAVQACPPSAWYRLRKFVRRHKAGVLTTAAVLLVVLLAAAGAGWVWWDRAGRRMETERAVSVTLARAEQWAGQAEGGAAATSQEGKEVLALWGQADAALAEAEASLHTGAADAQLRQRVADVRRRLEEGRRTTEQQQAQVLRRETLLRDLDAARLKEATGSADRDAFDYAGAAAKYRAAFAAYGLEVRAGDTAELARRIRAEEPAVRDALLVALDDWGRVARQQPTEPPATALDALAAAADDDAWRKRYRAAWPATDRAALRDLSAEARRSALPPSSLLLLAGSLSSAGEREEALALLRWARGHHPTDFWLHFNLGTTLTHRSDHSPLHTPGEITPVELEEAIGCYRAALALRPDEATAHNNLGNALRAKGQLDEAIAEYKEAIRLKKDDPKAHSNLGALLCDEKHDYDGAITAFRVALRIKKDLPWAHNNLGNALRAKGQLDEAIAEYKEAIRLKKNDPDAHNNLGIALQLNGRLDDAISEYREAIRLKKDFAKGHNNLGNALKDKGQLDKAIAEYREAIRLKKDDPEAHCNLGNALQDKGQLDDAIAEYREAIRLKKDSPEAHNNLGLALSRKGQVDEAIDEYREAIRLKKDYPHAHNNLGLALSRKGQVDEAIDEYREAIRLKKDYAEAHCGLGTALKAKGQLDEAIACYKKAIALDPKCAMAHNSLGVVLCDVKRDYDGAIVCFRKAIALEPKHAQAHFNLGNALHAKCRLDEAIAEYREALRLKKDYPGAHANLAVVLQEKSLLDEAIAEYREVVRLKPDDPDAHNNLGILLQRRGRLDEAIAEYREAVRLETGFPEAHYNIGLVLQEKGLLDEAIAEYREALRLKKDYASARAHLRAAERLAELDKRLPAILEDKDQPRDAEWIELGKLCYLKQLHRTATRFYDKALAAQPALVDDRDAQHRYNAACAAALAGCAQGKDAGNLDDKECGRLRRQALDWLRADLEAWGRLLDREPDKARAAAQVAKSLRDWLLDPDFVGVRGLGAFYRLPVAERPAWQKLWNDVTATRNRARAVLNLKEDDPNDEIAATRKAVELHPQMPAAHAALGHALWGRDRAGAIVAFRKAVALDPEYVMAHVWLGGALLYLTPNPGKAELEEAVASYSKAIELEPGNISGWGSRGSAYQKLGQWQKALDDYSRAIRLFPNHLGALRGRAEVRAATGQWAEAIADYEKAIEAAQRDPWLRSQLNDSLAWLLATCPDARFRDPARAVERARQAVELAPKGMYHRFYTTLGVAYYGLGDPKAAVAALGQSRSPDPVDWLFLALSHAKLGAPEEARQWYDKAVLWLEKNSRALEQEPRRAEELRRFRSEAEDALGPKKK